MRGTEMNWGWVLETLSVKLSPLRMVGGIMMLAEFWFCLPGTGDWVMVLADPPWHGLKVGEIARDRDGHQPNRRGSYTPSTDSLSKSGMTILQKKRCKKIMVWTPFHPWPPFTAAKTTGTCRDKWSDFIWRKVLQLHVCPCAWERPDAESKGWLPVGVSWFSHNGWGLEN